MLTPGNHAPSFRADSTQGVIDMDQYVGKQPIVLIFYPKDQTPGCTAQLCAVRDSKALYAKYNAAVFGINPAGQVDHKSFAESHQLDFPLISDSDEKIRTMYGVGKILGLFLQQRIVYVIDLNGKIVYARKGLPSTEEIINVLADHAPSE